MNSHLELKNKVKEYRLNKGWSQTELAEMVGSSRNTISSIENGQFCPTAYLAALLCIAFECKFEDLFFLERD
jgi:putative transcriptional regulator